MPCAVWLDLAVPESARGEDRAAGELPDLISELIAAGWEVIPPVIDSDDDDAEDGDEGGPPELLDVRVFAHPSGAFVGVTELRVATLAALRRNSPVIRKAAVLMAACVRVVKRIAAPSHAQVLTAMFALAVVVAMWFPYG